MNANNITIAEITAEIRRELNKRKEVYPKMVASRRLAQTTCDRWYMRLECAIDLLEGRDALPFVTVQDVINEMNRELKIRFNRYPAWIKNPNFNLTRDEANTRYSRLKAGRDILKERYQLNVEQGKLAL